MRSALIILFGAVPATIALVIAAVAFGLYRFQVFGPGPLSLVAGIAWFAMALWGTSALWLSLSRSARVGNAIGLIAGLLALLPAIYLAVFRLSDSLHGGLMRFGWLLLPALVAISLLAKIDYRRRR